MDQVPVVVEQARNDQRTVRARLFSQQRGLQRVLELVDSFAGVSLAASLTIDREDLVDMGHR